MITNCPLWVEVFFILITICTIWLCYQANGKSNRLLFVLTVWSIVHSFLAFNGFYRTVDVFPPRFALVFIPVVISIVYGIMPKRLAWLANHRNLKITTFSHVVRFPVEIVLFQLFVINMIPELMTFEGRNFDILFGLSAAIVGFLNSTDRLRSHILIIWNMIGLGFILFIYTNGILSAELPFQQFGFEQPNKAINYFPFILLPATIVPIVIWTHLSDILILRRKILNIPFS